MKVKSLLLTALVFGNTIFAQDTISSPEKKTALTGYIRSIHVLDRGESDSRWLASTGFHLRTNLIHSLSQRVRIRVDTRSRFIYGSAIPPETSITERPTGMNESINLRAVWLDKPKLFAFTNIERATLDFSKKNTNLIIGRQRIHWGIASSWNPNDIFQVGNPFDPDYAERPGADAIRLIRSTGPLSGIEFALARTHANHSTGALRYFFNRSGYDLQIVWGWFNQQACIGLGYSGAAGDWSLRGEAQALLPTNQSPLQFHAVVETDKLLPVSSYMKAAFLFNHQGTIGDEGSPAIPSPEPNHLMPGKWNGLIGWSREPSLRFRYGIDVYYTSSFHRLILFPKLESSLNRNWSIAVFLLLQKKLIDGNASLLAFFRLEKAFSN